MVMSTMPIKYAVPAGSARTRLLTACAARYTGCTVRGWDVWDGLDTHPASQNSGRFGYSFGKTRIIIYSTIWHGSESLRQSRLLTSVDGTPGAVTTMTSFPRPRRCLTSPV